MASYKQKMLDDRKATMKASYQELRDQGKNRNEALKVMQPIFELTPESMKVIMFNKNYNKKPSTNKTN